MCHLCFSPSCAPGRPLLGPQRCGRSHSQPSAKKALRRIPSCFYNGLGHQERGSPLRPQWAQKIYKSRLPVVLTLSSSTSSANASQPSFSTAPTSPYTQLPDNNNNYRKGQQSNHRQPRSSMCQLVISKCKGCRETYNDINACATRNCNNRVTVPAPKGYVNKGVCITCKDKKLKRGGK